MEMRLGRTEELSRMRVEDHDTSQLTGGPRLLERVDQQGLMPPMHAIEVADGDRRTVDLGRNVPVVTEDAQALRGHRALERLCHQADGIAAARTQGKAHK